MLQLNDGCGVLEPGNSHRSTPAAGVVKDIGLALVGAASRRRGHGCVCRRPFLVRTLGHDQQLRRAAPAGRSRTLLAAHEKVPGDASPYSIDQLEVGSTCDLASSLKEAKGPSSRP